MSLVGMSTQLFCYFFQVDALQRYCQGRTSHVIHFVTNHSHSAQR